MSLAELARSLPAVRIRVNRNRRLLVSLRVVRGAMVLSLHERLLEHPEALADLTAWVQRGGRGEHPVLHTAMREISSALHLSAGADQPPLPPVPLLAGPVDLGAMFSRVHATWFAHVSRPSIAWSRASSRRQQHIRFGCYRRQPAPLVTIHPRLDQPWVAVCFLEHVLFHELCHHAQACAPIRGEAMHGPRFRAWERRYPQHALALAWERAHLRYFLDGTAPGSGWSAASFPHSPQVL